MANSGVAGSSPAPRKWVVQAVEHRESHQPLSLHLFKPRAVTAVRKIKTVNALGTTGTRWLEPSLQQCRNVRTLVTVAHFGECRWNYIPSKDEVAGSSPVITAKCCEPQNIWQWCSSAGRARELFHQP